MDETVVVILDILASSIAVYTMSNFSVCCIVCLLLYCVMIVISVICSNEIEIVLVITVHFEYTIFSWMIFK